MTSFPRHLISSVGKPNTTVYTYIILIIIRTYSLLFDFNGTCARLCPLTKRNSLISIKNKGGEVGIILTTTGYEKGAVTITVLRVDM